MIRRKEHFILSVMRSQWPVSFIRADKFWQLCVHFRTTAGKLSLVPPTYDQIRYRIVSHRRKSSRKNATDHSDLTRPQSLWFTLNSDHGRIIILRGGLSSRMRRKHVMMRDDVDWALDSTSFRRNRHISKNLLAVTPVE
jgi:hypothetical protein